MTEHARTLALALLLGSGMGAMAQGVQLAGTMGERALLMIDGQPHTLAVGATVKGVTLVNLMGQNAEVRRDGNILMLRVGAAPVSLGGAGRAAQGREVVLPVGSGGHVVARGSINGRSVQFMVDTGATFIALSQAEAQRIGLDYQRGEPGVTQTANGPAPVHMLNLAAVRLGEVELSNVRAVVVPSPMPYVLLGNSFLSRFNMRRDGDTMRLELRP